MNPTVIVSVLVGLIVLASGLGVVWRARNGHVRRFAQRADRIAIDGAPQFGYQATLLQFSTEVCAPCRATHALLERVVSDYGKPDAIKHIDINVTEQPELVGRFNLLQSPTTFILDGDGTLRARIGGTPQREVVATELQRIISPEVKVLS